MYALLQRDRTCLAFCLSAKEEWIKRLAAVDIGQTAAHKLPAPRPAMHDAQEQGRSPVSNRAGA